MQAILWWAIEQREAITIRDKNEQIYKYKAENDEVMGVALLPGRKMLSLGDVTCLPRWELNVSGLAD